MKKEVTSIKLLMWKDMVAEEVQDSVYFSTVQDIRNCRRLEK
jgi:hypothetical protein